MSAHPRHPRPQSLSLEQATTWLTYPDAPLTDELRQQTTEKSLKAPRLALYAHELREMSEASKGRILSLARTMRAASVTVLRGMGIEPTPYAHSLTPYLWDMAKQRYWDRQPTSPDYSYRKLTGDALSKSAVRHTVIARHVGWEIDCAARFSNNPYPAILNTESRQAIQDIIDTGQRNGKMEELNSLSLFELGETAITAIEETNGVLISRHYGHERLIGTPRDEIAGLRLANNWHGHIHLAFQDVQAWPQHVQRDSMTQAHVELHGYHPPKVARQNS